MDEAGDDLLAGTAFTPDQNWYVSAGDLFDFLTDRPHGFRLTKY